MLVVLRASGFIHLIFHSILLITVRYIFLNPVLQKKKVRLRDILYFAQSHTASK